MNNSEELNFKEIFKKWINIISTNPQSTRVYSSLYSLGFQCSQTWSVVHSVHQLWSCVEVVRQVKWLHWGRIKTTSQAISRLKAQEEKDSLCVQHLHISKHSLNLLNLPNAYIYLLFWSPQKMCACFLVCSLHPEDGALLSASQFSGSTSYTQKDWPRHHHRYKWWW